MRSMHRARILTGSVLAAGAAIAALTATAAVAAPAPTSTASPAPTATGAASGNPPPIAVEPVGSSPTGPLVGVSADDGATVVAQKWLDARTVDITVKSPAVGVSLPVRVLVPTGWRQTSAPTYPLVMMLHGGEDDYTSWTRSTDIESLSAAWNVVIAMPEAGRAGAYTDYVSPGPTAPLKWETFHTTELPQLMQRAFGASTSRAVAGLSAGGYGAMDYAARHQGMFRFAASYSGQLTVLQPPVMQAIQALDVVDGTPDGRYGSAVTNASNWAAHDPTVLASKMRGTSLYVSSGLTGLPSAQDTVNWTPVQEVEALAGEIAFAYTTKLMLLGIPVTTHYYTLGEHAWASWQDELHRSWPQMMTAIGAKKV